MIILFFVFVSLLLFFNKQISVWRSTMIINLILFLEKNKTIFCKENKTKFILRCGTSGTFMNSIIFFWKQLIKQHCVKKKKNYGTVWYVTVITYVTLRYWQNNISSKNQKKKIVRKKKWNSFNGTVRHVTLRYVRVLHWLTWKSRKIPRFRWSRTPRRPIWRRWAFGGSAGLPSLRGRALCPPDREYTF